MVWKKLPIYLNVEIINDDVKHEKDVKKIWWKHCPKDMKGRRWNTYVNEQSCNDIWRIMCDLMLVWYVFGKLSHLNVTRMFSCF